MPFMSVTLGVLKALKSRDFKELQPLNMTPMIVTFEVLKLLKSMDDKDLQS